MEFGHGTSSFLVITHRAYLINVAGGLVLLRRLWRFFHFPVRSTCILSSLQPRRGYRQESARGMIPPLRTQQARILPRCYLA
jgi:hypothetical protein